jgi:predicted nucleotidyltransferase
MASATAIRKLLTAGEPVDGFLPAASFPALAAALAAGHYSLPEHFERLVLARILRGAASLRGIYQVEDGLDQRLFEAAARLPAAGDLAAEVKARHLTRTRIQRILCYLLNDIEADDMAAFLESGPLYLRLLGASKRGQAFLGASRKSRTLPLLANLSRVYPQLRRFYGVGSRSCRLAEAMLACELRATRIHTLLLEKWTHGGRNRDFHIEALRLPESG